MRMRLIDAEPLKELFPDNGEGSWTYNATVKAYIDAQPTIQPDIIRCKDCKYYREYGYVNGKPKFLPRCTFSAIYVDADDFCSKAERREQDE